LLRQLVRGLERTALTADLGGALAIGVEVRIGHLPLEVGEAGLDLLYELLKQRLPSRPCPPRRPRRDSPLPGRPPGPRSRRRAATGPARASSASGAACRAP